MKANAIMRAMEKAEGRGMAEEALNNIPEGGKPAELPAMPETGAIGPPDVVPPVETGGQPEFDEATGLPLIVVDRLPDGFSNGDDDETDEDGDDMDYLL